MNAVAHANVGADALEALHRMARMDEACTLRHDDGFSWWPDRIPVRFRWRAPRLGDAHPVWRLSAEVDALRGVDPSGVRLRAVMLPMTKVLNQFSTILEGDALRFRALLPLPPEVSLQPETTNATLRHLLYRAACTVTAAERVGPALARALGTESRSGQQDLRPACSDHPTTGPRPAPATLLHSVLELATFVGRGPPLEESRPDLDAAMAALRQAGCGMIAGPRDGEEVEAFNVVLETRHATSLLELRLDEPNPNVGHGLLTVLHLRFPEGHLHADGAMLAQELAAAEWAASTPLHVCGAWTSGVAGGDVAYSSFHPNLLHRPELGCEVALDGLRRVRWAFDHLGYTEPFSHDGPYANVLLGRPAAAAAKA
jgi:hypothetical protein